ncbi:MAG: nucleotide pyrophosphohydrolase [Gemmatimonadaceae bacterium]
MSSNKTLDELQAAVVEFAHERDWEQFHDAKNLSMALASEVGELNAVLRWVRNDDVDAVMADRATLEDLRLEIGDVAILLLLLCARVGVNLDRAVSEKLEVNSRKYSVSVSRGSAERPGSRK